MRHALLCGVALVALVAGSATDVQAQDVQGNHQANVLLKATLRGGNEVPPVSTAAFGTLSLDFNPNLGWVNCTANVWNAPTVVAAHLHLGDAGVNGSVVVSLNPASINGDGSWDCSFALTDATMAPDQGLVTTDDLGQILMGNGGANLYGNVHTATTPSGEIRGQVMPQ